MSLYLWYKIPNHYLLSQYIIFSCIISSSTLYNLFSGTILHISCPNLISGCFSHAFFNSPSIGSILLSLYIFYSVLAVFTHLFVFALIQFSFSQIAFHLLNHCRIWRSIVLTKQPPRAIIRPERVPKSLLYHRQSL